MKVFQDVSSMSLDIILQCAFSFKSNCQVAEKHHPYVEGSSQLVKLITERYFNPLYLFDWIYWRTSQGKRMKILCEIVHAHAEQIIAERRAVLASQGEDLENDEKKHYDFLDIFK